MTKKQKRKRNQLHHEAMEARKAMAWLQYSAPTFIDRQDLAEQAGMSLEEAQKNLDILEQEGLLKQFEDGSISILR